MESLEKFYKLACPDGWDFYTGKTINYRDNIGKIIKCPKFNANGDLCTDAFIHASRKPNQCFVGAKIPCSAYLASGKPIKEDNDKCGFEKLKIIKELIPSELFEWNYNLACNPIHPFKIDSPVIDEEIIKLLKDWASVRDSVGDSVWAYTGFIFSNCVKKWKYFNHKYDVYPFQPSVDLWNKGLIASFDERIWRLHGKPDGKILWEGGLT